MCAVLCRSNSSRDRRLCTWAGLAQRSASAAIDFGDDFSRQSTQTIDNYDNFDQTIMDLEASQIEDPVYRISSSPTREPLWGDEGGDLQSMLHSLNL